MTQAQQLIAAIRLRGRRGMTYGELQSLRISTAPHKRLAESAHKYLGPRERLERKTGKDGLVRFVVAR